MLRLLKPHHRLQGDRGASALIIAGSMVLIMGVAAIAIDASAAFVERRGDQSAVDIGTMAGATEVVVGTSGGGVSEDNIVSEVLSYTRSNLPKSYSDTEWQTHWENCIDPESERNTESGDDFKALDAPSGWSVIEPDNWCVSVDSAKSLLRVRTPDQIVDTTFGNVIGFGSLRTHASAVAGIEPGEGNILPFGFPSSAGDGLQHCLSSAPTGLADDPCTGASSGNFGTLKVRRFTPSPYQGCNVAPLNSVLALNIAAGSDHTIVPDSDGDPANEVRDICYNFLVDTLETDPGFPSGTEWGLATGNGLPPGEVARLQQGPQTKTAVAGNNLDDQGLWHWLLAGLDYDNSTASTTDDAPKFCDPAGFTTGSYDVDYDGTPESVYDFDGDGTDDPLESWQHMQRCLTDYAASPGAYTVIFSSNLGDKEGSDWSARFGYIPQFWESSLGSGGSWLHVKRYRAIFIQGTWWKRGPNWVVHAPGEPCTPCGDSSFGLQQVSAWIIPDDALPAELRGDPPSSGVGFISPFKIELTR